MSDIFLDLSDDQALAVEKAVSTAEAIWRGEFSVVADLAAGGLLRSRDGGVPGDPDTIGQYLNEAVARFRDSAGVPIFAGKPVGYDADSRSLPDDRLPLLCEALDLFTRVGLVQFVILNEVGREEVFAAPSSACNDKELHRAQLVIEAAGMVVGHSPRGSHSIGSPHLDIVFKRAYECLKVARRLQAELSGSAEMLRSVHGDGLVVRYTQDPAPAISVAHPTQKAGL